MIQVLILTGLRAMEISALRWEDYDEGAVNGPILRVERQYDRYGGKERQPDFRAPKCNSRRIIPVSPVLKAVLCEQKAETRLQDDLIFYSENGRPVCNKLLRKALERTCRRAGIRRISPQVLRRTFVSHLIMSGEHPKKVQYLAGHKNFRTTEKFYAGIEPEWVQNAGENLEEHLMGESNNKSDSSHDDDS